MRRPKFVKITFMFILLSAFIVNMAFTVHGQVASGTHVPVIVNIYPNSGVTEQEARDAIEEANRYLGPAGFRLHVVRVNNPPGAGNGDDGSGGGTAGDGKFTRGERDRARTFGGQELGRLEDGKGIKISFADEPMSGRPGVDGVAVHRNPTIIVEHRNRNETGYTIAHEFGHVMTIANDSNNASSIMYGSGYSGTGFSPNETEEMQRHKRLRGFCSTQFDRRYPAVRERHHFGAVTDDYDDHGIGLDIYDINQVYLVSLEDAEYIEGHVSLSGVLSGEVDAEYALGFDADADSSTGVWLGEQGGIEKIVYVRIEGDAATGELLVSGEVVDAVSETKVELPETPVVETSYEYAPPTGKGDAVATDLLFTVPKNLLGLTGGRVPVTVTAGPTALVYDTAELHFDREYYLDEPVLETSGTGTPAPGEAYEFYVKGLGPGNPFDVYVDDKIVLSGNLDSTGSYSGDFVFPVDAGVEGPHFLTVQDLTGDFAYSITCPSFDEIVDDGTGGGSMVLYALLAVAVIVVAIVVLYAITRK